MSGVGVKKTSYYPYLSNLLNFIGKHLKPRVRCIIHPRSIGAGLPDGALITADQKTKADDPLAVGLIPSRGVVEVKAPDEDVSGNVGSEQVAKYLSKYGLVFVTNLRDITGKLRKELNLIGRVTGPQKGLSIAITAGWGHGQKEKDIIMPGRGIEKLREFTAEESATIAEGTKELGLEPKDVTALWGAQTLDIYLNNETFWGNVPESVWEYTIGGYQVLKKWLSYREHQVLGRDITKDEAREFTHIVRRIAALLLLAPELDKNYTSIKANCHPWKVASTSTKQDP